MWQIYSENAGEYEEFRIIEDNLDRLVRYAEDFSAALSLFNFCNRFDDRLTGKWAFVPARDGGMTIYHIGKTIELTRSALKRAPTLDRILDQDAISAASRQYRTAFETFEKVRHAISHSSELYRDKRSIEQNRVREGFQLPGFDASGARNTIISNSLIGRLYTNTIDGVVVTYEISQNTKQKIYDCVNLFVSGFKPVYEASGALSQVPVPRW